MVYKKIFLVLGLLFCVASFARVTLFDRVNVDNLVRTEGVSDIVFAISDSTVREVEQLFVDTRSLYDVKSMKNEFVVWFKQQFEAFKADVCREPAEGASKMQVFKVVLDKTFSDDKDFVVFECIVTLKKVNLRSAECVLTVEKTANRRFVNCITSILDESTLQISTVEK